MEHQQADKMDVSGIIYVTKDFETTREIVLSKAKFRIPSGKEAPPKEEGGPALTKSHFSNFSAQRERKGVKP